MDINWRVKSKSSHLSKFRTLSGAFALFKASASNFMNKMTI